MFITQAHVRTCTIDIILLNKMLEILVGLNKTTSAIAMEVKNETEDGLDSFL